MNMYFPNSQNMTLTIDKVGKFFNKSYNDKQVATLVDHLSIENFRKNPSVNFDVLKDLGILKTGEQAFIRKGMAIKTYYGDTIDPLVLDSWNSCEIM